VTGEALATWLRVSVQRANARVRPLEGLGLVGCERQHVSQARAVFLTGKGHELLGWERRRAPRAEVHHEYEAAIVWLVTQYERVRPDERVLTERECRHLERVGSERFSVDVSAIHDSVARRDRRRWPDVVLGSGGEKRAIEIEFAPKGSKRLRGIVDAYAYSGRYLEAVFLVKSAALGHRIRALAPRAGRSARTGSPIRVEAWTGLPRAERAALTAALRAPSGARWRQRTRDRAGPCQGAGAQPGLRQQGHDELSLLRLAQGRRTARGAAAHRRRRGGPARGAAVECLRVRAPQPRSASGGADRPAPALRGSEVAAWISAQRNRAAVKTATEAVPAAPSLRTNASPSGAWWQDIQGGQCGA